MDDHTNPIYGYDEVFDQSLGEATKPINKIIPEIDRYVAIALSKCKRCSLLTFDESAAIYLYTMDTHLYRKLNQALRNNDKEVLELCRNYLKLLITACKKLPAFHGRVWRAVNSDYKFTPKTDCVQIWWQFSSTSQNLDAVRKLSGRNGTLFSIEVKHGRNISEYSAFSCEKEIILMPGTRLTVVTQEPFIEEDCLNIIQLEEW